MVAGAGRGYPDGSQAWAPTAAPTRALQRRHDAGREIRAGALGPRKRLWERVGPIHRRTRCSRRLQGANTARFGPKGQSHQPHPRNVRILAGVAFYNGKCPYFASRSIRTGSASRQAQPDLRVRLTSLVTNLLRFQSAFPRRMSSVSPTDVGRISNDSL